MASLFYFIYNSLGIHLIFPVFAASDKEKTRHKPLPFTTFNSHLAKEKTF